MLIRGTCLGYSNSRRLSQPLLVEPQPASRVVFRSLAGEILGHFLAVNRVTGEKKWEIPLTDMPSAAGMLATGGGLIFTGRLTGEFLALDKDTGKTLWQFQTGSSVNSTAITYTHKGRQYVTVASGLGGILATRYASRRMPTGGSVWTFALSSE